MALRKVATVEGPKGSARVFRDTEWDEYQAKGPGRATYHTPDRDDAIRTARTMVGRTDDLIFSAKVNGTRVHFRVGKGGWVRPTDDTDHEQCDRCGAPIFGDLERDPATVFAGGVERMHCACGASYPIQVEG